MDKIFVYEVASSSGVQKRFDGMHLASVGGTDLYRQNNRCSTDVEGVGGELSGESLFPFGPLKLSCPDQSGREKCVYRFTDICINLFYVQYSEPIY